VTVQDLRPIEHATWCDGDGSVECWACGGEGTWHDIGDDCYVDCGACEGTGRIRCPACEAADKAAVPP
jgi:hypothetical protein